MSFLSFNSGVSLLLTYPLSPIIEQLNLNKVKSKSMLGFITRTSIKVLAHNISFLINKLMGNNDSLSKIKRLVFG